MRHGDLTIMGLLWTERKGRSDFAHQLNGGETDSVTRLEECDEVGGKALKVQE